MKFFFRTILCALLLALPLAGAGAQTTPQDSTLQEFDELALFNIAKTRLIRWIRANKESAPKEQLLQVLELLKDAQLFADQNDFETAQLFLDTAFEITRSPGEGKTETARTEVWTPAAGSDSPPAHFSLTPQVITGIDLWRQEFDIGLAGGVDTTYYENSGNPFTGVRLTGSYEHPSIGTISTYLLAKASRDYYSSEMQLISQKGTFAGSHHYLENRFEWSKYRNTLDLQYWQNHTRLQGGIRLVPNFTLLAGDEIRIRNYQNESELYPNYMQNQVYAGMQYTAGYSTRLAARYNFGIRKHRQFPADDYREHRVDASVYQVTATNSSIFFENVFRSRDYVNASSDSTYRNPYTEEYFRGDMRFGLTSNFSFGLQGDVTLREHRFPSTITPDFLNVSANPRFLYRFANHWQAGVGYLYLLRVFRADIIRTGSSTDPTASPDISLGYEDYFTHGISVSLELFRAGSIMLSFTHNFELRTYPNSSLQNVPGFPFYTDRQINSSFLFLSWQMLRQLELNILANYDDDRSRINNHSDARNGLFSIDLTYSFR